MKKYLPLLVISASLLFPIIISAETRKTAELNSINQRIEVKQQKIEDRKTAISTKMETVKEKVASRQANFKQFKDQKKAEIATKLETNFNTVNQNRVSEMNKFLDQLTQILNKIIAKSQTATPSANLTTIQASITKAQTAIITARTAVTAQQAKTYSIATSTETNLAANAKTARQTLFSDLKATFQTIQLAKNAVRTIFQSTELRKGEK